MAEPTHQLVEEFTTSFPFDRRLYAQDIAGSIAHCEMLAKQRIIPANEARRINTALRSILKEFATGRFRPSASDEDVHMAVERRLIEKVGAIGGKLHTARSRNDQVALDLRLYLRDQILAIRKLAAALRQALAKLAARHKNAIMPGYTHLQPAQPVLFGHHCMAYAEMLLRDEGRLADCARRMDVLPLGSGAIAGTTFPIDRHYVARRLGFSAVSDNSMDAVADRDFAVEFLAAGAILGMHLSRFCEDLVLWSTQEFGFIDLPDAFATGSSMMPQKKNPDIAELIRGKTGRLYGNLMSLLTALKGLPLTYNRDMQEDKEPVFDTVDTLRASLSILAEMLPRLQVRVDKLGAAASRGFTLATDLADYLSAKGLPFRKAHEVVGRIVRHCVENGETLEKITAAQLSRFSELFKDDVKTWLTPQSAVRRRRAVGGTSPSSVRRQIQKHLR
jgi:argininosuccinate lyase